MIEVRSIKGRPVNICVPSKNPGIVISFLIYRFGKPIAGLIQETGVGSHPDIQDFSVIQIDAVLFSG